MLRCPAIIPICRVSDNVCALMMRSMFALFIDDQINAAGGREQTRQQSLFYGMHELTQMSTAVVSEPQVQGVVEQSFTLGGLVPESQVQGSLYIERIVC